MSKTLGVTAAESKNELETVNKALLFTAQTELPDEFKTDINVQLNALFNNPEAIDNGMINEFASISSAHMVGAKDYQPHLNKRVMHIIGKGDDSIVAGLTSLRAAAQSIVPQKASLPKRVVCSTLKLFGYDYDKSVISKAVTRFDTAEKTIGGICEALGSAKDVIKEDLATMLQVGDDILSSQFTVARDIFFIERLLEKLDGEDSPELPALTPAARESLITSLRQDLLDLKALEAVNAQYLTTLEQTCRGARLRIKSVERACGLTMKVAAVGLLLKSVLENNTKIQNACDASSEFTSQQLVENAKLFQTQTVQLEKSMSQTFVSLDKLREAHSIIMTTLAGSTDGLARANEALKLALGQMENLKLPNKLIADGNTVESMPAPLAPPVGRPTYGAAKLGFLEAMTREK